jgi:hypothetical protein
MRTSFSIYLPQDYRILYFTLGSLSHDLLSSWKRQVHPGSRLIWPLQDKKTHIDRSYGYLCRMKYADKEIQEMEEFFKTVELPQTIEFAPGVVITDVKAFVFSHLQVIRLRKGVGIFEIFYDRLVQVKEKLSPVEQGVA